MQKYMIDNTSRRVVFSIQLLRKHHTWITTQSDAIIWRTV